MSPELLKPEKIYGAKRAAKLLGVSRATVWRMFKANLFPGAFKTMGGHIRLPASAIGHARTAATVETLAT